MSNIFSEKEEAEVFTHIKKYLSKQPFLILPEIINYTSTKLRHNENFNVNKIELIVKTLIKKKRIIPGTKLVKDDILGLEIRKDIFNYINRNPGSIKKEVLEALNLGSNQLLWHLKFLEKFEYIRIKKIGTQKVYFNQNLDSNYDLVRFYLKHDKVNSIIELLENENTQGLKITELADSLGMHFNTGKKYLKILSDLKVVRKLKSKKFVLNKEILSDLIKKTAVLARPKELPIKN